MTPKERAQAIYDKFYVDVDGCDEHYDNHDSLCKHQAKQCSIICVEQIIDAVEKVDDTLEAYEGVRLHPEGYWKEVLEILKNS